MIKEKLAKLIDVKTIITLLFATAYVIFIAVEIPIPAEFVEILKIIIIFYFGTQAGKAISNSKKGG